MSHIPSNFHNEVSYKTLQDLSTSDLCSLEALIRKCDGYEPYYLADTESDSTQSCDSNPASNSFDPILMFAAFYQNQMIGFLSLMLERKTNTDKYIAENTYAGTAELTGLVAPEFRRQGVFSHLFFLAKNTLASSQIPIIGALTDALTVFPFVGKKVFSEYMLRLSIDSYEDLKLSAVMNDFFQPNLSFSDCEYCFTQDYSSYLMYLNESSEEPCAVLNLSFEKTFSNVYGVWVEPALRSKGYGTALMQAFLDDYFNEFHLPLILNVRDSNTAAFLLYKKCGFTEVSHISYYIFE